MGVGLIALGLLAGVVLSALALAAPRDAVGRFARARAGCTTTLQFERTGTFTLYLETKGRMGLANSECGAGTYEHRGGGRPQVSIDLVDSSGAVLTTTPSSGGSYRLGAYRGDEFGRVRVEATGEFELTVRSPDDVAVAVGGDPYVEQRVLSIAAIVATVLGVLMGATLVVLNRR